MKERPILFSGAMVRAILEGRKTQTRRVVKPQPTSRGARSWDEPVCHLADSKFVVGRRLWVRETWQGPLLDSEEHEAQFREDGPDAFKKPGFCAYRATDTLDAVDSDGNDLGWRPSIHMPRWASRILLEVTGVRVERLNDISKADAIAEGAPPSHPSIDRVSAEYGHADFSRSWYAQLWDQINGPGSWDANPWVWVVEFKRVEGGAA